MTQPPTGQGGPGRGQGRKPRAIPRKAVTVRLEPQDAELLRAVCEIRGVSQAAWVAQKIQDEAKRCGAKVALSDDAPKSPTAV